VSFFNRSCKEVASLVVAQEDRGLSVFERLAVRAHMVICVACPVFERQILTMRNATRQWRNYSEPDATLQAQPSPNPPATQSPKP
jgi:hypothetical protein